MRNTFRSLAIRNFRVWFAGSLASNIGTWMQRTAQSWVVFTQLTQQDAKALGLVMALQFGPQLVLAPLAGVLADRVPKRALLLRTQLIMGALATGLGLVVLLGVAQLWHVCAFALLSGVAACFDATARQAFVSEIVDRERLSNAVALTSASFNVARLTGPAVAGLLTVAIGAGPVFLLNAISYAATIAALRALREDELRPAPRVTRTRGALRAGLRYVAGQPRILAVLGCIAIIGTFGLNFPVFAATMAAQTFQGQADLYGYLNSLLALGSLAGSLQAARRERARFRVLLISCALFCVTLVLAAWAPDAVSFGALLVPVGFFALSCLTTANALVQDATEPPMRGRVMSVYTAIMVGGTPVGAPLMGWIATFAGPRWSMTAGGIACLLAIVTVLAVLRRAGPIRWRG